MSMREGGCLCGAVRFKAEGEPIMSGTCYCRHCQYIAGGGAAYAMLFPKDAVTVVAGEVSQHTETVESGAEVYRLFCPVCGVHLFSYNSRMTEFRAVKAGVFDDPGAFRSQVSIWTSSAQPWHDIPSDVPAWEQNPEM